jgi:demethylmenaquinone methyltransferase/2-methoxy-6-polyprenyl-1,4-benzoquinol methylase
MVLNKKAYKWFYDHVHSYYYNLLMKWCFLPFGGERKCREELLTPVKFSNGDRILDMCCGTGGATYAISTKASQDSQVYGLDLSKGQLRVAKSRSELSHVQFVEGDAAQTPFSDAWFDKVFITHAIHEMPREIRLKVLAEGRRILKDDGTVIILELDDPRSLWIRLFIGLWFFYWLPFNFETPTRRDMLERGVAEEVGEAGFKNVTKESKFRGILQVVQAVK